MSPPEWFTPCSARRALDHVRPLAERIHELYRELEQARVRARPDQRVDTTYFRGLLRWHDDVERLGRHGVRFHDPGRGLLVFPARRSGRPVWLCWCVGESSLRFWIEPHGGHAARLPVDDDGPWDEAPSDGGTDDGPMLD